MWSVVEKAAGDENACLFFSHQGYKNSYQSGEDAVAWNAPEKSPYNGAIIEELSRATKDAKCTAILQIIAKNGEIPEGWFALYAKPVGKLDTEYVISNKPDKNALAIVRSNKGEIERLPIFDDEEITENSKINFQWVNKETGGYYRDLFIHKLGTCGAEDYLLMTVDGRVTTSLGLITRDLRLGNSEYAFEIYGITRTSQRYNRLGKLFIFCLTSGDFKRMIYKRLSFGLTDPKGVRSSSVTEHDEAKTDRNVMKLIWHQALKNGMSKSMYQGEFREDTWGDVVRMWLKRYGHKKRG